MPAFPVEILTYIIMENLTHDLHTCSVPQLNDLRSCALTCKLFTTICHPYFFRHIRLGVQPRKGHIIRLLDVLDKNPQLANHVRELTIIQASIELNSSEVRRCKSVLSSFSRVETFTSLQSRSGPWPSCVQHLTAHYLRQGTVRSLNFCRTGHISLETIFSNRNLHHLRLEDPFNSAFHGPKPNAKKLLPTCNITTLHIEPNCFFPLPYLLALPKLEVLHYKADISGGHRDLFIEDQRAPSFMLKELHIKIRGGNTMETLIGFYIGRAQKLNKLPFAFLESLDLVATDRDLVALTSVFRQEFHLKTLRLEIINHHRPLLSILPLIPGLSAKLATCSTVQLKLRVIPGEHDETTIAITDMFSHLSHHDGNILESLTLTVNQGAGEFNPEPWVRLRNILADKSAFPLLKLVKIGGHHAPKCTRRLRHEL
ncbi:hypothetical protein BJ165DRAFT_1616518 [Panaeolus papilionaceus]|nr:hypothetical protein BJ165DRAFT_1616518 [Panaeolus papilionaceus]